MKKFLRVMRKSLLGVLCTLAILLAVLTVYHHAMLGIEAKLIVPNGRLYEVNGHLMHVHVQGQRREGPTIVLLSGSGTTAPVYDFKALGERLSQKYRTVVVERSGYGYSEISGEPRDIGTILQETRQALIQAGETGPYILMPHSISGIEALYWAQEYPQEVLAIIGLDMTVPQAKDDIPIIPMTSFLLKAASFMGLQRIPFIYPITYIELDKHEREQVEYLTYRNAFDLDISNEIALTYENIDRIDLDKIIGIPVLAFVSNDPDSRKEHAAFAEQVPCQVYPIDAGHYIHQFEPDLISEVALDWINNLLNNTAVLS